MTKFRAWSKAEKIMSDVKKIDFCNCEIDARSFDETEIEEVILMQSTGLLDKNGTEVYIGDIIKCTRGCPHEVYLEKEYGGTFIGGMPAVYLKGIKEGYSWIGAEEVIGNIYENPELIKQTKGERK